MNTKIVKKIGMDIGFDIVKITNADSFFEDEKAALKRFNDGYINDYPWYDKDRIKLMNRPTLLLEGAKSVISLGASYLNPGTPDYDPNKLHGKIAKYALGDDYHKVLKERLKSFCTQISECLGQDVKTRIFVDDGPMNDRAAARRSGLGWVGKNTNIITENYGSWVLLGQVITDLELDVDEPLKKNCGNCVRCIDDCPTGAIVAPYVIDNSKCISYLTIELKGIIPRDMRPLLGDWIFGCDICQDVCPVNRKAKIGTIKEFEKRKGFELTELLPVLDMDQDTFSKVYKNSPIKRTKLSGLKRNVCVALGNIGDVRAVEPLSKILKKSDPVLKIHAAWALGRIGGMSAYKILLEELDKDNPMEVKDEIKYSLADLQAVNGKRN
ncbi:MAG: tRNA epoxyqueuosine(34) reductase QueG [Chloroflexi bacterium]|nr:tRNA epoxyqueuosine(34) reductase QueG [Chloroflexota bacterium]|tara:strand:+ start:1506 stop:2651 length:1146 start_codon:yes stop_codon:yes gene_type:complete